MERGQMTATDGNRILLTFLHFSVYISIYFLSTVLLVPVNVLHDATFRSLYSSLHHTSKELYPLTQCRNNYSTSRYQKSLTVFTAYIYRILSYQVLCRAMEDNAIND